MTVVVYENNVLNLNIKALTSQVRFEANKLNNFFFANFVNKSSFTWILPTTEFPRWYLDLSS